MTTDAMWRIGPLEPTTPRDSFDCGVEALNRYFREQVGQDMRRHVATAFVATARSSGEVAGFYTLSMASVALDLLPTPVAKRLPRYPTMPAVRLGRLAVDLNSRGRGLGNVLLMDALARSLRNEVAWVMFIVNAKDQDARRFYAHFGFQSFEDEELHMYIPRKTVEPLFAE